MAKKLTIPEEVINSDAYLYFENRKRGGHFQSLPEAFVYNKTPQTLSEQLKQSRKFQFSQKEVSKYLKLNLNKGYQVPKLVALRALGEEFVRNPLLTPAYLAVWLYTRTQGKNLYVGAKRFWKTDVSTKRT